jgi:hypothetical protein
MLMTDDWYAAIGVGREIGQRTRSADSPISKWHACTYVSAVFPSNSSLLSSLYLQFLFTKFLYVRTYRIVRTSAFSKWLCHLDIGESPHVPWAFIASTGEWGHILVALLSMSCQLSFM